MCFKSSKPPADNSAEIARQQEDERQKRIAEGRMSIDNAFTDYSDGFFNNYQNEYVNFYKPQLEDQYQDARNKINLQLAKTGNLTSSYGNEMLSDIKDRYGNESTGIVNRSLDSANQLRGNIDSRKSQLYNDNIYAADPANAAAAARGAAQSLQPAQLTSPLANVFTDFFDNIGIASAAKKKRDNTGVQNFNNSRNSVSYY